MSATEWITLASDMISEFGRVSPVTFTREVETAYSTSTLETTTTTSTTYICNAAPVNFKMRELDGVVINQGEKMLYIPGVDTSNAAVSPQNGDTVVLGSVTYRVLEVLAYETESVNCAFLLKIGA